jgi:hypothetical protein
MAKPTHGCSVERDFIRGSALPSVGFSVFRGSSGSAAAVVTAAIVNTGIIQGIAFA